jgi:hypothetical protein
VNAQPGAPEHDDHRAQPPAVSVIGGVAHDGDDLVDRRWVGGVAHAFVARWSAGVVAGQGRRRAAPPRGIQQHGHRTSSDRRADTGAALHGRRRPGYCSPWQTERLHELGPAVPDDRGSSGAGASGARSETPAPARAQQASGTVPHVPVRVLGADVVILAPPSASCISRRGPGLRRVRLAETAAPRARSLCWSSSRARPGSGSCADLVAAADLVGASACDGRASVGVVG